ncbi:MAG: serine acetyltransferase [Bacteroidales bacterium]|nr:serine acetyltransferase [Bacteroidales bacterium]
MKNIQEILSKLTEKERFYPYEYKDHCGSGVPYKEEIIEAVAVMKSLFFPDYYKPEEVILFDDFLKQILEKLQTLLPQIIHKGFCFDCADSAETCKSSLEFARTASNTFLSKIPEIKDSLISDVHAAYLGDPAAKSHGEVILCYPVIQAMIHHRVAHELYKLEIPIIPRMISEMAHSETGIDIHPGAKIGRQFTIDHGTGVVIGETCVIGDNVKIYQGVTLGAKSFPLDENGNPIKGIARHPIVGDNVIIYANATILGRVSIGENAVIGGNTWVTKDVEANSRVTF